MCGSSFYEEITRYENIAIVNFDAHSFSAALGARLQHYRLEALQYFYRQVSSAHSFKKSCEIPEIKCIAFARYAPIMEHATRSRDARHANHVL